MPELKTEMTLKEVNAFLNDLWKDLIKPTWQRDMSDDDWGTAVYVAGNVLPERHGDSVLVCKMVNAYLTALEIKAKEGRKHERNDK